MKLFPAIDLYGGNAVRLFKGDYNQLTVYHRDPLALATQMEQEGAKYLHTVDLEGAKDGTTPHLALVKSIAEKTSLFVEIGGGIRDMKTAEAYINAGVDRIILGTAAVKDPVFLKEALASFGDKVAVGVDIKDGLVAIHGWQETAAISAFDFMESLVSLGAKYVICTDISKDGAMQGTNRQLYRELSAALPLSFTASGGVSSIDDLLALKALGLYAAILGKAYYTGAVSIPAALAALGE